MTSSKTRKAYFIYKTDWIKRNKELNEKRLKDRFYMLRKDIYEIEKLMEYEEYKSKIPKIIKCCGCGFHSYNLDVGMYWLLNNSNVIKMEYDENSMC